MMERIGHELQLGTPEVPLSRTIDPKKLTN